MMIVVVIGLVSCVSLVVAAIGGVLLATGGNPSKLFGGSDDSSSDTAPEDLFIAGKEEDVGELYSCLGNEDGHEHLGKTWDLKDKCLITYKDGEEELPLVKKLKPSKAYVWTKDVTAKKIFAGKDRDGGKLAICRAMPPGATVKHPGKTTVAADGCWVGYEGKEYFVKEYELATYV